MLFIDQVIIFLIAIIIDLTIGDPPEKFDKFYPVVWISRLMYFFDGITRRGDVRREKILGVVYPLLILSIFSMPCLMLLLIPSELLYIILSSLIFKMTFTIKGLERYGRYVMEAEDLEEKREAVGKIVSREVANLDVEHLNSATIESVAENTTDSIIAPFFYFSFFGVFGAMFYRVVNTLDAVVGYKSRKYIHFGWFSAKLDAIMNYIPERIAAGLIFLFGDSRWEYKKNVPFTIVAMSSALKVKLEKIGHYSVGIGVGERSFEDARDEHIKGAIRIMKRCSILFAFVCILVMFVLYLGGWSWFRFI
jgi:adenosylcobinamide-phosphate synthase